MPIITIEKPTKKYDFIFGSDRLPILADMLGKEKKMSGDEYIFKEFLNTFVNMTFDEISLETVLFNKF